MEPRVASYWADFCAATGTTGEPADVFSFGSSPESADELVDLVLVGTKRATAESVATYDAAGWRPKAGDLSVVLRGDGSPALVIRTTETHVGRLTSVTAEFAEAEGEWDRTRGGWIEGHREYFRVMAARNGTIYDDDPDVVFERFELVWPTDAAG